MYGKKPAIERRVGPKGESYRVRFTPPGRKQTSRTFDRWVEAEAFANLVHLRGPQVACQLIEKPKQEVEATPTVAQWAMDYIDGLTGVTEGTRRDYRSYVRGTIAPVLGDIPITLLARLDVSRWINSMERRGLSGKTIKNRHAFLSASVRAAVRANLIPDNVAEGVRLPRQDAKTREATYLTPDEYRLILAAMRPDGRPLLVCMAGTGMRIGEATALQVRDLSLAGSEPTVRVVRAWKHTDDNTPELGPPKSKKGKRTITLSDPVAALLGELAAGRDGHDWLLLNPKGGAWRQNQWREDYWHPAVRASGIGKRPTPHDLRHSHASWLIAQGVSLPVIQQRLGHEKITTTVDTYGHLTADLHRGAAFAIGAALGGGSLQLPA